MLNDVVGLRVSAAFNLIFSLAGSASLLCVIMRDFEECSDVQGASICVQ